MADGTSSVFSRTAGAAAFRGLSSGEMRPLALVLLLSVAASAQEAQRYKPFYEIDFAEGARVTAASGVLREMRQLHSDWPGLVTPVLLKKVLFMPEGFGNAKYCWNPDAGIVGGDDGCVGEHMAVVVDPDLLLGFEEKYPDFYKPGAAVRAVLFHELLHGWAFTHPADLERYSQAVSDGRRTVFERKHHKLMKPIWALERALRGPRLRVEMGDMTREQWKAQGDGELQQLVLDDQWTSFHDGMSLAQARETVAKYEERLKAAGARAGSKIARYNARKNIPGRGDHDIHATENDQEWWAYGGEIYFFAKDPAGFLSPKEMQWWKDMESELKGGSRGVSSR